MKERNLFFLAITVWFLMWAAVEVTNLLITKVVLGTLVFAAFGGPLLAMAVSLGISPESILYTFLFSGDRVFLPYEFVSYLIFFSFGMMTTGQFVKYHAMKNVATVVFFMVVMLPYWRLIGLV